MKAYRMILPFILVCGMTLQAAAVQSRSSRKNSAQDRGARKVQKTQGLPKPQTVALSNDDEQRYEQVKAKAKADPTVRSLKAKSDSAMTDAEAREASISYTKALFRKMRQIDGNVGERTELVEQAVLRRINGVNE